LRKDDWDFLAIMEVHGWLRQHKALGNEYVSRLFGIDESLDCWVD
jgi:hypothetical protein